MVGIFNVKKDGEGSVFRATARHWTSEAYEQHLAMRFDEGWGAIAEQLKALAEQP